MKRFTCISACLTALLLSFFSCTPEETPPVPEYGGQVSIRFATGDLNTTRATTPGNEVVADGGGLAISGGIPDLVILIANNITGHADYGKIVKTFSNGTGATLTSCTASEAVITFDFSDKPAGNYMVYAFGNTGGLWTMTTDPYDPLDPTDSGIAVELSGAQLTTLTTAAQVEALRFKAQNRVMIGWEDTGYAGEYDNGVEVQNSRLPVSAKAPLTVSSRGGGEARLELLRCVAKVSAKIINNMDEALDLYNYKHTVHSINPTTGYVIPHGDDFIGERGNLLANPSSRYGLPDLTIHIDAADPLDPSAGSQEYDFYVFPTQGPFQICIQFTLNKGNDVPPVSPGDPPLERTYSYTNLPVTNWRAENILSVERNQHLKVETRISKGVQVSFNFTVADWTEYTASVTFD